MVFDWACGLQRQSQGATAKVTRAAAAAWQATEPARDTDAPADRRDARWLDVEQDPPGEGGEDSGGRQGPGGDSLYPRPELDVALGPCLRIRRVATSFCMDGVSVFPRKVSR